MEIKKKIAIWSVLCALMVSLFVPVQARAAEYSIKDWCIDNGYEELNVDASYYIAMRDSKQENILVYCHTSPFYYQNWSDGLGAVNDGNYVYCYTYKDDTWDSSAGGTLSSLFLVSDFKTRYELLFVNHDVCINYGQGLTSDVLYSETTNEYTFKTWCSDADLNCGPSSETDELIFEEFVYNPKYRYIVTKNVDGYEVAQIYSDSELDTFTELVSYDNKLYMRAKDGIDASFSVRRYVYNKDGWLGKLSNYYTVEYGELTDLEITISTDNRLYYSSSNIKTGATYGNVYYSANTGFTDGFVGEETPDSNPNVTVTPVPDAPSVTPSVTPLPEVSGGYNAITYNPALNGVVSVDSVYMRKMPSKEAETVGAFIKGWSLVLYGSVQDSDGGIWYYCQAVRDDVAYIGYVCSDYVTIKPYVGNDADIYDTEDLEELAGVIDSQIATFLLLVGSVPQIIGVVFGFLPTWCLTFAGLAFAFLIVVMIYKTLRG